MSVPILVKISAFKCNFGPICGLYIYNALLYTIYSPQIGPKLHLKAEIKKKNIIPTAFFWFIMIPPPTADFTGNHSAPGGQNWKKKQWLLSMESSGDMWH